MDFENSLILLHLLWILPMFGLITYYASSKRKKILCKIFGSHSRESQYTTISKGRRYLKIWLMLFAIIFLVIAAARPRWGWRILPFSGRGRDVMLVLDVSKSMNSTDVQPTRLKHAKLFIRNLIKKCPGDRFGLVAFAGSAFLDCPLTVDKTSLFQTLDEINCNSIPLGGTNVENALNTAISAFKAAEGGYRAIVLLTDGDELHGDSSKSVAKLKKMKIPLFIVGVGDPDGDGLIKLSGANGKTVLMRDSKGDLVKSRLNERQLKKLKDATGGIYVRSTATSSELSTIIKKIQGLVPKEYEKGNNKRPIERFHFPLFVAVILLLLILGISERRKGKKNGNGVAMKSSAVVIFLFCATLSLQAQTKKSKKLPIPLPIADEIKEVEDSAAKEKKELSAVDLYNKALKLQNENKIEEAAKLYNQAINRADGSPEVRGKSFQNLGVISHAQARTVMQKDQDKALEILKKSEIMYKEAMRSDTHLKKVILNQQKLLDDRVLAKKLKKQREEMKKKQEQAQKKTKEALDEQKKQNKQEKKKNDEKKKDKKQQNQNKNKADQQKQEKNKQEQKQNKQSKQEEKKSKQNKSSKNDKNKSNNQKSKDKLKDAQKAVEDLEKEAKKRGNKKVEESAKKAKKELKKAEDKQKSGEGKKSEEHIKKALDHLGKPKEDKKKECDKKKKNEKQDEDKKDKKDKKGQQQNKNRKLDKGKKEDGKKGEKQPKKEQEIDPRQAKAILEMMANDEKNLRDAIKENQKINSKTRKVLKDW